MARYYCIKHSDNIVGKITQQKTNTRALPGNIQGFTTEIYTGFTPEITQVLPRKYTRVFPRNRHGLYPGKYTDFYPGKYTGFFIIIIFIIFL